MYRRPPPNNTKAAIYSTTIPHVRAKTGKLNPPRSQTQPPAKTPQALNNLPYLFPLPPAQKEDKGNPHSSKDIPQTGKDTAVSKPINKYPMGHSCLVSHYATGRPPPLPEIGKDVPFHEGKTAGMEGCELCVHVAPPKRHAVRDAQRGLERKTTASLPAEQDASETDGGSGRLFVGRDKVWTGL